MQPGRTRQVLGDLERLESSSAEQSKVCWARGGLRPLGGQSSALCCVEGVRTVTTVRGRQQVEDLERRELLAKLRRRWRCCGLTADLDEEAQANPLPGEQQVQSALFHC